MGEGLSQFRKRYSYQFEYNTDPIALSAFYLKSIQKIFQKSSESAAEIPQEPKRLFTFQQASDTLKAASWTPAEAVNEAIQRNGVRIMTPQVTTLMDLDESGQVSIDVPELNYSILKRTQAGFERESLPSVAAEESDSRCRSTLKSSAFKRNIIRLRGPGTPLEVYFTKLSGYSAMGPSKVVTCNLEGKMTGVAQVPGNWVLSSSVFLADLSRRGKPDLIKFFGNGKFEVLQNLSTAQELRFAEKPITGSIKFYNGVPKDLYFQDINGDGVMDIVSRNDSSITVWYGKGNYQFEYEGVAHRVLSEQRKPMPIAKKFKFTFEDINGDGVPELIVYGNEALEAYFLDGKDFVRKDVPAFRKSQSKFKYLTTMSADLLGTGNYQMISLEGDKAYALELTTPGTGLLQSVDDGKGNRIEFQYAKANPEKGLGRRPTVLSSVRKITVGKDPFSVDYHYSKAKTHRLNQSLLGFDQ